jgi:hypothetical protein
MTSIEQPARHFAANGHPSGIALKARRECAIGPAAPAFSAALAGVLVLADDRAGGPVSTFSR